MYFLKPYLATLASLYTPLFKDTSVELVIENNIPNTCWAFCDSTRLSQITSNLLSNALKFTEQGFVKLKTEVINSNNALTLAITVTDSGRGMTPSFLESLFSPTTQRSRC
ncbi:sensor histidine kinase (plasmid) [Pseudoalteromonas espejiana]